MKKVFISSNHQPLFTERHQKRYLTLPKQKKLQSQTTISNQQKNNQEKPQRQQKYKYYLGLGNNSSLIGILYLQRKVINRIIKGRILSTRKQWQQINDSKYLFLNFKWQQTNKSYKYQNCIDNKIFKHSLNHFQFHHQLSNKQLLYKNLCQYCQAHKLDVFDIVPLTFVLNFNDSQIQSNISQFLNIYNKYMPLPMKSHPIGTKNSLFIKKKRSTIHKSVGDIKQKDVQKLSIKDIFIQNTNSNFLWILKPTFLNRGNGIHVFNTLQNLQTLINSYITGQINNKVNVNQNINAKIGTNISSHNINSNLSTNISTNLSSNINRQSSTTQVRSKSFRIRQYCNPQRQSVTSFVIQKYLQKPLLIDGRKFDIRMWVLISHEMKVYLFKQGYIRTSSYKYSTSFNTLSDNNIHLTNNAIQKHNTQYGKYEDGNQLSFKVLKNLIQNQGGNFNQFMTKIKNIVKITALSVKKKINKNQRSFCFQIFGYDFMVDINCKPWLIQVNTNPCIQQSSELLSNLLPRMLDDAFCLTLDRIFETQKKGYNYTIQNEYSTDNLWQLIVDLKKPNNVAVSQQVISQTKVIGQ